MQVNHNPASKAAIEQGYTCPVMDNAYGGEREWYWVNENCPLHGKSNHPKTGELGEEKQ